VGTRLRQPLLYPTELPGPEPTFGLYRATWRHMTANHVVLICECPRSSIATQLFGEHQLAPGLAFLGAKAVYVLLGAVLTQR
jgi:hypothetical protein